MSATAKRIVNQFIGEARNNPDQAPDIFRRAAYTFMGLAQDPKNAHAAKSLAKIGLDFAGAAAQPRPPTMDDFHDLLQETVTAYDEVGDGPMDLIARRREVHDERSPLTPGHVSIAPDSFNKDATLGRSAVIKFQPTQEEIVAGIQQSQNVAFWQGVKKEAQAMTIDVGLVLLPPPGRDDETNNNPLNVRPYGTVEYGSDGNRTTVVFDISTGVRFTVVGNYISVSVAAGPPIQDFNAPPAPPYVPGPTAPITVGASIGTFAAPSDAPLIKTEYIDYLVSGATTGFIAIPIKAVQLLPVQSNLALGETAQLDFYGYGGGLTPLLTSYYVQAANSSPAPIPLTGDISFVRVKNNGANQGNFRLPFQLSL